LSASRIMIFLQKKRRGGVENLGPSSSGGESRCSLLLQSSGRIGPSSRRSFEVPTVRVLSTSLTRQEVAHCFCFCFGRKKKAEKQAFVGRDRNRFVNSISSRARIRFVPPPRSTRAEHPLVLIRCAQQVRSESSCRRGESAAVLNLSTLCSLALFFYRLNSLSSSPHLSLLKNRASLACWCLQDVPPRWWQQQLPREWKTAASAKGKK